MQINKIICGNHLDILKTYSDNFFDMFITSPPYDDLRDYEGYVFNFESLAFELFRTLKEGGRGVWIVNDTTKDFCKSMTSFKQALFFAEKVGFKFNDHMIYHRKSQYPTNQTTRTYARHFESVFILSKGNPCTFNPLKDVKVKEPFKKITSRERDKKGETRICHGVIKGKTTNFLKFRGNVWHYANGYMVSSTDKESFLHPAMFPEKLAEDHILSWSNPGDIVLDPMCGSGTSCKMALKHGRRYVGIDCAQKYCDIAESRIDKLKQQKTFFEEWGYE